MEIVCSIREAERLSIPGALARLPFECRMEIIVKEQRAVAEIKKDSRH